MVDSIAKKYISLNIDLPVDQLEPWAGWSLSALLALPLGPGLGVSLNNIMLVFTFIVSSEFLKLDHYYQFSVQYFEFKISALDDKAGILLNLNTLH